MKKPRVTDMTWREMNNVLAMLKEVEVEALIAEEQFGKGRSSFLQRLHRRFCTLRTSRERIDLMRYAKRP